jgi:uncharacterized damage-inducible protein DinB
MNADLIRTLYDYNYWARDKVWGCCDALSDEQFTRNMGYSWGSIHDLWVHMMSAEWIWFSRLRGASPAAHLAAADYPTRAAIRARWAEVGADVRGYLGTLTDADLTGELHYRSISGTELHNPRWATLMQVINHATDHRAQVLAMVHQLGGATLEPDLIFFLREGR